MDIKNISDIAKIIALCRKKGVECCKITPNGIELTFGDKPVSSKSRGKDNGKDNNDPVLEDLTPEQKLLWSVGGLDIQSEAS